MDELVRNSQFQRTKNLNYVNNIFKVKTGISQLLTIISIAQDSIIILDIIRDSIINLITYT